MHLKVFIYKLEEEIIKDKQRTQSNEFYLQLRKNVYRFISKSIERNLPHIEELYLNDNKIGIEGAEIIALMVKHISILSYVDLSGCRIDQEGIKKILQSVKEVEGYFTLNLEEVSLPQSCLKFINIILLNDGKKKIDIGTNDETKVYKSIRIDCIRKKKFKK